MGFYKSIHKYFENRTSLLFLCTTLPYSILFLLIGYRTDIISNSELITYKLFLTDPGSIKITYNHWLSNCAGALIVSLSGQYSIFILRLVGIIIIFLICLLVYKILSYFYNKKLSIIGIFFLLAFVVKNYTILDSSLITGLFYILFIFFIIQALKDDKDYLFFFAGVCLSLNFFTDFQNILCLLCVIGIFAYYKFASVPNGKQNKQFIPLISGISFSSILVLSIMKVSGQLDYYIYSIRDSYNLFQNSISIYSNINIIKSIKALPYNFTYWLVFTILIFFLAAKLINLKVNKLIYIFGIAISSILASFLINDYWIFIFIGLSLALLLLYIFNILKCSNEFRLMCILSFIMEVLLNIGILRDSTTQIYGSWIGIPITFIFFINFILDNCHISISMKKGRDIKKFTIKSRDFFFIFISLITVYLLCSVRTIYNNCGLLLFSNSAPFSNSNYINTQIKDTTDKNELNSLAKCIERYNSYSKYLLTQNDINALYFITNKAPFLGYTIYDEDSVPMDVQINDNINRNHTYPIVVIKKALAHDVYYNYVTEFVKNNYYKSVCKTNNYEVFIPMTNYKK